MTQEDTSAEHILPVALYYTQRFTFPQP